MPMQLASTRPLPSPSPSLPDLDDFEIVETGFHYPLLARWTKSQPGGVDRTAWAVASHVLVYCDTEGENKNARKAIQEVLGPEPLQFRDLSRRHSFRVGPTPSTPGFRRLTEEGTVLRAIRALHTRFDRTGVRVEPDYLCFVNAQPSDLDFAAHQTNTMKAIRAPEAWDRHQGSREVIVAVVDTGIDYQHPDLQKNLLRDLDGEVVGWNFLSGLRDADDDHWHGTYCAGLIGAEGDNGIGMAGVNWKVSLLPVKAFSSSGIGASTHAGAAIVFAVDNGAAVVLCAWGSTGGSPEVLDALKYADSKGCVVVAAAGNSQLTLDQAPHFPASFVTQEDLPNVISVSATDNADNPLPDAASSPTQVHLSAPGKDVYSTFPTRLQPYLPYHVSSGTSAAAALVAGGCALLRAYANSRQLERNHYQIREAILNGVDRLPHLLGGKSVSAGRLNLDQAMKQLDQMLPPPPSGGRAPANGGAPASSGTPTDRAGAATTRRKR